MTSSPYGDSTSSSSHTICALRITHWKSFWMASVMFTSTVLFQRRMLLSAKHLEKALGTTSV